jgi:polysaccharide biosynthesis protein PslG
VTAIVLAGCGGAESEPGGQEREPERTDRFGVSAGGSIEYASARDLARELDGYVELGVGWIRFDLRWFEIERRQGTYEWARYERVVHAARRRRLRVLATLAYAPSWARPGGSDNRIDPRRYARFAAAVVRHFAPLGVKHYELWNEPNLATFWRPQPNAERYSALVTAAYRVMKDADPSITVVAGGLAPVGGAVGQKCRGGASRIDPIPFLAAMYRHGAGGSFDAVGYHPYTMPLLPGEEDPCSAWHQLAGTAPSVRSVMEANGDARKRIWATEFGARADVVGEDGQAAQIRAAVDLWPRYAWAGPLLVYAYRDTGNDRFNLVRADWSRRPAWRAYRDAIRAADGRRK